MTGEAIAASGVDPAAVPGALHAAEHTAIGMLPLLATCDRWDIGGLSSAAHPETGQATVIVHDAVPGGSGCARRGFERGSEWVLSTLDALLYCPCDSGCPRCIQSPKCGNNNEPLSKNGATRLISTLSRAMAPFGHLADPSSRGTASAGPATAEALTRRPNSGTSTETWILASSPSIRHDSSSAP